jgi:beta-1,4-N-acetylglucosaminyltransferase
MIFVTVGQHVEGFDRLVRAADEMAGLVQEQVVIQRGGTRYVPRFAQYVDFVAETQMEDWLSQARVVISHGGAGSIIGALLAGKPLVVVPRLKGFGEAIDDHQLELAKALSQQGKVIVLIDLSVEALQCAVGQELPGKASVVAESDLGLRDTLRTWLGKQSILPAPWFWRLLGRNAREE